MDEGFDYPPSTLGGNGPWTNVSGNINVTLGNLSYGGLPPAVGNQVSITSGVAAGTTPANFTGSAVTSGSVFMSFLAQATTLPTANNYILSLLPTGGTPNGSTDALAVYVGQQVAGSQYKIGVRHQGIGTGATYASTSAMTLNSINFYVVEYRFGPAAADDTVLLYVNPTPGEAQPAANVTVTGATGIDAANLQVVGFKAQSAATQGNWNFDSLRVGDTWEDVTPTPEPSALALAGLAGMMMLRRTRRTPS